MGAPLITKEALQAALESNEKWLLFFAALVAIGVAGEAVWGFKTWRENRQLKKILLAEEQSSQLKMAELTKDANEAKLELAKLKTPRAINTNRIKDFTFLTEKVEKVPIRICIGNADEETWSFAIQLRGLFKAAGFPTPPGSGEHELTVKPNAVTMRPLGNSWDWPAIMFLTYGTNKTNGQVLFGMTFAPQTNPRFKQPVVNRSDDAVTFVNAFDWAFQGIGIKCSGMEDTNWVNNGEFAILVPGKNL